MAKRHAENQATREAGYGDSSEEDQSGSGFGRASAEVLAQRKIALPRSRLGAAGAGGQGSNPFSSLKTSDTGNPFSNLGKSNPLSAPATTPVSTNYSNKSRVSTHDATALSTGVSKEHLRIRALNEKFAASINRSLTTAVYADWRQMCEHYIRYYDAIASGKSLTATPEPSNELASSSYGVSAEPSVEMRDTSETKEDDKPETEILKSKPRIVSTGFRLGGTGSSNSASTTFTFGNRKVDIGKTHSSTPSTGGFVFQPGGSGEIRIDKNAPNGKSSDSEDDSEEDRSSETNKETVKTDNSIKRANGYEGGEPTVATDANLSSGFKLDKPSFKFSAASPTSSFKFGANSQPSEGKPAFTFGSNVPYKPEPGKGDDVSGNTESSSKPLFSFGQSKAAEEKKAAFSFGSTTSSTSKPEFTFEKLSEKDEKQPFTFNTKNADAPVEDTKGHSKPTFTFGQTESAPSGASLNTPSQPFTFGKSDANSEDKPAFSFGKPQGAPAFSFGNSDQKTASSFGNSDIKPGLAFGSNQSAFSATWKPGQDIKIVSEQSTSTSDNDEATKDQQLELDGKGPGEEDENSVYEKRAKAFEQIDNIYHPLGLGMLRVLVHKETKQARVVLRAEGSGRVLLNVLLRPEFQYPVLGKGQVRILDVKAGSEKPTIYVARVKTEEDGKELSAKLETAKLRT